MDDHGENDTRTFICNNGNLIDGSPRTTLTDDCAEMLFDPVTLDPLPMLTHSHNTPTKPLLKNHLHNTTADNQINKTRNKDPRKHDPRQFNDNRQPAENHRPPPPTIFSASDEEVSSVSTLLPPEDGDEASRKDCSDRNKEQALLQEIQYTYYNLLERYVREKKRVILLEAELLECEMTKINSDAASYYTNLKRKAELLVCNEEFNGGGTNGDVVGHQPCSPRDAVVAPNYVLLDRNGTTNVARVGILSPERKEDGDFVHKNSVVDPKDAVALFFVVMITFLIVGIIIDNL